MKVYFLRKNNYSNINIYYAGNNEFSSSLKLLSRRLRLINQPDCQAKHKGHFGLKKIAQFLNLAVWEEISRLSEAFYGPK